MLTEPVECKSCNSISVNGGTVHCHGCFKDAIRLGFMYALDQYGIWKDGVQTIGAMQRPIKTVIEQFDSEGVATQIAKEQIELAKSCSDRKRTHPLGFTP